MLLKIDHFHKKSISSDKEARRVADLVIFQRKLLVDFFYIIYKLIIMIM